MPAFFASSGVSTMVEAPVSTIIEIGLPFTLALAVKWPSRRFLMRTSVSAARALLDGHGAAGHKLADHARGDRHQLVLVGVDA